jgi:hypothetical protein
MGGHAMISLIKQRGLDGALNEIADIRERLVSEEHQRILLILTEMQGVIAEQKKRRRVEDERG